MEMEGEAALLVSDLLRATHQTLGWVFAFPHAGSPSKLPGAGGATLPHRVLCCWVRRARLCRSLSSFVARGGLRARKYVSNPDGQGVLGLALLFLPTHRSLVAFRGLI